SKITGIADVGRSAIGPADRFGEQGRRALHERPGGARKARVRRSYLERLGGAVSAARGIRRRLSPLRRSNPRQAPATGRNGGRRHDPEILPSEGIGREYDGRRFRNSSQDAARSRGWWRLLRLLHVG